MKIELGASDLWLIRNALEKYGNMCDSYAAVFAGSGYDKQYKDKKEQSEKLMERIVQEMRRNLTEKGDKPENI